MSEEEVPFKTLKITMSEEAFNILESLRISGSFRSYSMTIEESIRSLFDILKEIYVVEYTAKSQKPIPDQLKLEFIKHIVIRLYRYNLDKIFGSRSDSTGT
jgi:hypothetical protein